MKYLLLICIMLITVTSKAQGVFGTTHAEAKDTLIKNQYTYLKSEQLKNGSICDEFTAPDGSLIYCFFNNDGLCYQFRRFFKRSLLIEEIEYLNKRFVKVDERSWVNSEGTTKVYLYFPNDNDVEFYVSYISMQWQKKSD